MFNWPRDLCFQAKQIKGVYPNWIDESTKIHTCMYALHTEGHKINHDEFEYEFYEELADCLLHYTRKYLTTDWMATYVIDTLLKENKK